MPHYSHIAARKIWRKFFRRTSMIWEGGGLVWCNPDGHLFFQSIHSNNCQFFYSSFSSNHPGKNRLCSIQFNPSSSGDDLCLPFCPSLILCIQPHNPCCNHRKRINIVQKRIRQRSSLLLDSIPCRGDLCLLFCIYPSALAVALTGDEWSSGLINLTILYTTVYCTCRRSVCSRTVNSRRSPRILKFL